MNPFKQHLSYLTQATEAALTANNFDGLWIYSGHPTNHFLDDMPPPHVTNPHFRWWVPLPEASHSLLHINGGKKPTVYLYQPADYWHKTTDNSQAEWTQFFEVKVINDFEQLPDFSQFNNHAWIGSGEFQPLPTEQTNPTALLNHLHFSRTQKTAYEIDCIKQANERALLGHHAARETFYQGGSEYEIHLAYLRACKHNEYQMPYGNIVAFDQNAAVLHYQHQSRNRPSSPKSFLIDAGATHNGYAADITRTYSRENDLFAEMIALLDEQQQQLCQQATVGTDYTQLHLDAHQKISQVLNQIGVFKCSATTAVEQGLSSIFFPHGLGHYLGLQVHDVGGHISDRQGTAKKPPQNHPFLRLTDHLRHNAIVTIEPGIYFIPMLLQQIAGHCDIDWSRVEQLTPYGGIRIEDNIVVKKQHPINLTRNLSHNEVDD